LLALDEVAYRCEAEEEDFQRGEETATTSPGLEAR
jgi:hypothetical protein